jgi:hypothetical protein
MEAPVDVGECALAVESAGPGRFETGQIVPPTFTTGPVPGRQSCRLIKKEELGVSAGLQQRPLATFELEQAGHPGVASPAPNNRAAGVMKVSPIAEEQTPTVIGHDGPPRGSAVLMRHAGTGDHRRVTSRCARSYEK